MRAAGPEAAAEGRVGRPLTEQEVGDLSDEQRVQLLKIAEQTAKVAPPNA